MPLDANASAVITALSNAPEFAKGAVRDLRVRWAFEEIGRAYRTELFDAMAPRSDGYLAWHPFNQVPAFDDGEHRLFESGAILLYLGEQDERLLPREPAARWRAIEWAIAALNSVEPPLMRIAWLDLFHKNKPWAAEARPAAVATAEQRLKRLADALRPDEWLAGRFSIADILMTSVFLNVKHTDLIAGFPTLAAYRDRAQARPAFRRALADQIADIERRAEEQPA